MGLKWLPEQVTKKSVFSEKKTVYVEAHGFTAFAGILQIELYIVGLRWRQQPKGFVRFLLEAMSPGWRLGIPIYRKQGEIVWLLDIYIYTVYNNNGVVTICSIM